MTTRYTVLGNTDEVDSCDCCGKKNLKATVALNDSDTDTVVYFGVVCAARAMKIAAVEVRQSARAADKAIADAARAEQAAKDRIEDARWQAFLDAAAPALRGRRLEQILSLGGMKVARPMYQAQGNGA